MLSTSLVLAFVKVTFSEFNSFFTTLSLFIVSLEVVECKLLILICKCTCAVLVLPSWSQDPLSISFILISRPDVKVLNSSPFAFL